jgi:hypothetical protein
MDKKRTLVAGVQKANVQLILDTLRGELKKAESDAGNYHAFDAIETIYLCL